MCWLLICLESVCGRNEMADGSRSYCKARKICSGRWKNNLSSEAARQGVGTSSWGKMWALVCKRSFTFFYMFAAVIILVWPRLTGYTSFSMKTQAEKSSGNGSQIRNGNKCLGSYSSITRWVGLAHSCCFPFSQSQGLQLPSSPHTSTALPVR